MIRRVLVPMDDSELAERALTYALEAFPDAEITALHVVGEPSSMMGKAASLALEADIERVGQEHAEAVFDRAHDVATEYGVEIGTDVRYGPPAKEIIARAGEFDTVVLGSHSGSVADRLFVGNVARRVFRRAPVPVTVVR
jgi:nucleotide-binding universal stress UspA family protein